MTIDRAPDARNDGRCSEIAEPRVTIATRSGARGNSTRDGKHGIPCTCWYLGLTAQISPSNPRRDSEPTIAEPMVPARSDMPTIAIDRGDISGLRSIVSIRSGSALEFIPPSGMKNKIERTERDA